METFLLYLAISALLYMLSSLYSRSRPRDYRTSLEVYSREDEKILIRYFRYMEFSYLPRPGDTFELQFLSYSAKVDMVLPRKSGPPL
jgi:hypothetical protein